MSGQYDTADGFKDLNERMVEFEKSRKVKEAHRLFYLALPPSAFIEVSSNLKSYCHPEKSGMARLIVEKPFGHDLASSKELQEALAPLWSEEELYRIDHYLGKEMVKNLAYFRFANNFLEPTWNRDHVASINVSFKEPFGTEGRGGYFDEIGIIRDVMQNHLLQVLTLLTMEAPTSADPEAVRDAKVAVLKAFKPLNTKDILVGQYGKSADGSKPSYLEDDTVKPDSKCVTYAAIGMEIDNDTWRGVPIVMRAGKALNEAKVEARIQFKDTDCKLYSRLTRNELVIRIQPDEAVYMKVNSKIPGVHTETLVNELDLSYKQRYKDFYIPEAYESLIRDCLRGDHANFVRDDENDVSWALFTPLLKYLEGSNPPVPSIYEYGSRGPKELNPFLESHGYVFTKEGDYHWPVTKPENVPKM